MDRRSRSHTRHRQVLTDPVKWCSLGAAALMLLVPAMYVTVGARPVSVLRSSGALPAHIAGLFQEPLAYQQTPAGRYLVFDRRAHAVYGIGPDQTEAVKIVTIGFEEGRVLEPTAFAVEPEGTFVVADAPNLVERIQIFGPGGIRAGGFSLPGRTSPRVILEGVVLNGVGSLQYTGEAVYINQPETGALVTEYSARGWARRTFGRFRPTGQGQDRDVQLALNTGLPLIDPKGGFFFVFQAGTPLFRKYDQQGNLLFERHIEGKEIDGLIGALPTSWPRRKVGDQELPLVPPVVRTAAVDRNGSLWVSFVLPYTYVYDGDGDKIRTVQFRAAGLVAPTSLFFTTDGRLLITPGCFEFTVE